MILKSHVESTGGMQLGPNVYACHSLYEGKLRRKVLNILADFHDG
jgi:hypothetical protein